MDSDKPAGYEDSEAGTEWSDRASAQGAKKGKKPAVLVDAKREERNAREKQRSLRIVKQINEIRGILTSGGVVVPKGTKSSVLTQAADYIRLLHMQQQRSEM